MSLINDALKRAKEEASTTPPASGPPLVPVYSRPPAAGAHVPKDAFVVVGILVLFLALIGGALTFYLGHAKRPAKPETRPAAVTTEPTRTVQAQTTATGSGSPPTAGREPAQLSHTTGHAAAEPDQPNASGGGSPLAQTAGIAATGNLVQAPVSNLGKALRKGEDVARQVAALHAEMDAPEPSTAAAVPKPAPGPSTPPVAAARAASAPAGTPPPAPPPPQPLAAPVAPVPPATAAAAAPLPRTPSAAATALKSKCRLSGIVGSPTGRMALINSQVLKRGDKLEGATISAIESDHVTLQLGDEKVELRVTGLP